MKIKRITIVLFVISIILLSSYYLFQIDPIMSGGSGILLLCFSILSVIYNRLVRFTESKKQNEKANKIAKKLVFPSLILTILHMLGVFLLVQNITFQNVVLYFFVLFVLLILTLSIAKISETNETKPEEV